MTTTMETAGRGNRLPLIAGGSGVYRTRLTWRTSWVFVAIFVLIYGGAAITFASNHPPGSSGRWIPLVCAAFGLAVLHAFIGARTATAGIFTDKEGIRIRNPFMTARFLWEDIDRFELRQEGRHPCICVVILRDGTVFRALGIRASSGWARSDTAAAEELVDGLNAELRATPAMSIAAEFKARGIVHGGTLILCPEDALAMVARARERDVPILGVDGFWVTEHTTQPDMGHSIDLGGEASSWAVAQEFIRGRADLGLRFEVVADEEVSDLPMRGIR